jgi:hypothetical protein
MVTGAFSLVSKAGLRLGIEHPRDFGAFNTFPRSVWAHTHPLFLPQPRPPVPGHLTTLSVFSCPFTHPSFLPTYLLTFRPTQFATFLPTSFACDTLPPQCSSFLPPLAIAFRVSCARPPFLLFYFSTNCASALRRSPGSPLRGESHRFFFVLPILYFRLCF